MPRFNLPNRITLSRLLASVVLLILLALLESGGANATVAWVALGVFIATAATDWLDGHLARRLDQVTAFGRIMDPFVDKVLICGSFVFLAQLPSAKDTLHTWIVAVVILREFFVSALRGFIESRGESFAANWPGKLKMALQSAAAIILLIQVPLALSPGRVPDSLILWGRVLTWAMLASTVYSGGVYLKRAGQLLEGERI